ncbi:hypothetical protein [Acinetobacter sp. ANC 4558]|uniref:hypothetical protein n=1 Tax=Acinetobacter sp. ANC 4558 TaxID=1977876 RepID=UPI000A3574C7|nr:hypothetical protein [Acinetobacter sp. ANC 4558]
MKRRLKQSSMLATLILVGTQVQAQISLPEGLSIKPTLELTYAMFHSDKSYNDPAATGSASWQEGYIKYGIKSEYELTNSTLFANLVGISTATFGDGDAGGFTSGKERKTVLDEWSLGWKNKHENYPAIDGSIGRQKIVIADGFIVAGDALNVGKALADGELYRGGGYYLAAQQSFDFTTNVNVQLNENFKTHWYYLKSNNKAQNKAKFWATDWQYKYNQSDFGLMYLQILDVDDPLNKSDRKHLKDVSIRAKHQLTEQFDIKGEYVHQKKKSERENAWYVATNYTFDQVKYTPTIGYRYSSFSEHYDPLFYGNTDAGFGTWFQGEVAGNYAGPFNSNARIQQISLQASVMENLHLGVLAYQYNTIKKQEKNLNGHEIDLFAVWEPFKNMNVIPLIGFYKPKKDLDNLGTQVSNTKTNTYAQLILQYSF